jgi:predicted acyl esterase
MGANEWRTGDAWPLPGTQWTEIMRLTLAPSPTEDDIY